MRKDGSWGVCLKEGAECRGNLRTDAELRPEVRDRACRMHWWESIGVLGVAIAATLFLSRCENTLSALPPGRRTDRGFPW